MREVAFWNQSVFKKTVISLWLACAAMISVVLLAPAAGSPETRLARSISASIDEKIGTTLELAAASSAASLAVSALPGDTATPVAEKLADFSGGFLMVLCALYFEKTMFTVIGRLVFLVVVPAAMLLFLLSQFWHRRRFHMTAVTLLITGILVWLMIPVGLGISHMVYVSQQSEIQETLDASTDLSMEVEEGREGVEEKGVGDAVGQMITTVATFSSEMVRKAKGLITGFMKSLALMIVTACVIPIVVLFLFLKVIQLVLREAVLYGSRLADEG